MILPHGTVFAIVDGENFELYRNSGKEAAPRLVSLDTPRTGSHQLQRRSTAQ
ncbi:hypothetical protein ACFSTD_13925 [Novosphingobium colocasiae]